MNDALQIFRFQDHPVRVVMIDGEPWWVVSDVCRILGIGNVSDVTNRLDRDGVDQIDVTDSLGRTQKTYIANEPNLYRLIFRSDKPEAKAFQDWVFNDVLPSIRKNGIYSLPLNWINEKFALRQDANYHLRIAGRFTIDETTDDMAASRVFKGLQFSADAFPDTSIGKGFWPWVNHQGYDLSDVAQIKHLVNWDSLTDDPIYQLVYSYPSDPFKVHFDNFLRLEYWPSRFLPYLRRKYKGEERAKNIDAAEKLIHYLTTDKTYLLVKRIA